jgi:uncharacterized damage-inducible protein DinB
MSNPFVRKYVITGLAGTPDVLHALLRDLTSDDPRWDAKPYPDRFTLREIMAHIADWDEIWLERVKRITMESSPILPDIDEGQIAIDHDYTHQDPYANLQRFDQARTTLVGAMRDLPDSAWDRTGIRPPLIGEISLESLAAMVLGHDGYHTQQVSEWVHK